MSALDDLKALLQEAANQANSQPMPEPLVEVLKPIDNQEPPTEENVAQRYAGLIGKRKPIPVSEDIEAQRWNDPLRDTNFVTQEQMNDHYKLLLSRIQTQLSTIGGGGEVNFRMLDDVDRSTIADGLNLRYNAASTKFDFVQPSAKAYYVTRVHDTVQTLDHSTPQIITDMTLSPPAGTYVVNYNSKLTVIDTSSLTSAAKVEVTSLYADLSTRAATGAETTRAASDIYANETLGPGVYIHTGAITVNGKLTLNGSATDEFIFRTAGAFTTGTFAEIELTGGATSSNVWFVTAGAPSTGANAIVRGNFIADQAAPSLGATTSFEGRMLAVNGAIAIGDACVITAPTGTGTTSIGSLVVFSMFTGLGAVSNTGTVTTVALSIGTDGGAITGFPEGNVGGNLYPGGAGQSSRLRIGVYVDGVLLDDSRRQYDHSFQNVDEEYPVVLQTVVTLTAGQTMDVRGSAAFGEVSIGPRMAFIATLADT